MTWFSLLDSSVFALEKNLKNGKFLDLVTSKINFGGYFQQGLYTNFQKIGRLTMYERSSLSQTLTCFSLHGTVFTLER